MEVINKLISIAISLVLVFTMSIVPGIAKADTVSNEELSPEIIEGDNRTIKSEDGRNEAVFFSEEVRYKEAGELVEYDPSLVKIDGDSKLERELLSKGYKYENKKGDKKQYLPESIADNKPVVLVNEKYEISFSLFEDNIRDIFVSQQELTLEKEELVTAENELKDKKVRAEYRGERGSVEYISESQGIKENIIFEERPNLDKSKQIEIAFNIKVRGLELNLEKSGELIYKDIETGKTQAITEKPFMNDATGEAYTDDIEISLKKLENSEEEGALGDNTIARENTENKYELIYKLPREYFESEERVYPVCLDPSTNWGETGTSAYVFSAYPTYSYASRSLMPIGAGSGDGKSGTFYSYLKFSGVKSVIDNKSISSATLKVEQTGAGSSGQTVNLYQSDGVYTAGGLTWNNQPSSTGSVLDNVASSGTAAVERKFTITDHMQRVANNTANTSYVFKKSSSSSGYSAFHGAAASSSKRPVLSVTYIDKPTTASTVTLSSSQMKKGLAPTVSWTGLSSSSLKGVEYRIASLSSCGGAVSNDNLVPYTLLKSQTAASGSANVTKISTLTEGCYLLYLRGIDTNGEVGVGKSVAFHIDSTPPVLASASIEPMTTNMTYTMNKSPKISWGGATDKHMSWVEYKIQGMNSNTFVSLGAAASGMKELSLGGTGVYPITLQVVDGAGNISAGKTFSYYLDISGPEIPTKGLSLIEAESNKAITNWTAEENPKVKFEGVREVESKLEASGISYEILDDKKQVIVSDQIASNVNFSSEASPYAGTFDLGENAKKLESGVYTVRIRMKDTLGNETKTTAENANALELIYKKDILPPELSLSIENVVEGGEVVNLADLSGSKLILPSATEKPQDTLGEESQNRLKKVSLALIDSKGESRELLPNYNIDEAIIFDTEEEKNGKYELLLSAEDILGNKASKKLDIEIANRIEPPKAVDVMTNQNEAEIKWWFLGDDKITGLEYKAPNSDKWVREETEEKTGTVTMPLPEYEGDYEGYIRCVDEDGLTGLIKKVSIEVDKTAPSISELRIDRGIIYGDIEDKNGYEYKVYIKEESEEEHKYKELSYKSAEKSEKRLGIIDISKEEFVENSLFDIKVVATDGAGNLSTKVKATFKEEGTLYPSIEEPKYRIKRPKSQSYEDSTIYLGTKTKELELEALEGAVPTKLTVGIKWFVKGEAERSKEYTHQIYADDFSLSGDKQKYEEDISYPISAAVYGINAKASFSNTVVKNREVLDLQFDKEDDYAQASEELDGIFKEVNIGKNIVGLTIMGSSKARTGADIIYELGTSRDDLTRVKLGENYSIYDLTAKEVSADKLLIRVSGGSHLEKDLIRGIKLGIDLLDEENFKIRKIENYAAENVNAEDKINYKTYVRWDFEGEGEDKNSLEKAEKQLPAEVSFEVYRGESPNFAISEKNKIAAGIKETYYADINVAYAKESYYKVRAVRVVEGKLEASTCSKGVKSIGVDATEYSKRLGIKDYLSYSETGTPVGTISVEKSAGNLVYTQTDASINSENLPMDFERVYNSQSSSKSAFGIGMSHSFDMELLNISEETDDRFKKLAFKDETGSIFLFAKIKGESKRYISTKGAYLQLTEADEQPFIDEPEVFDNLNTSTKKKVRIESCYSILTKDNIEYKFNRGGQLLLMKEANGNVILFDYDDNSGRLIKVSNTQGLAIGISYGTEDDEDHALIKKISLPDGGSVNYQYEHGKLVKVTRKAKTEEEIVYTYKYDSKILNNNPNDNLAEISDAEGNIYKLEYDYSYNDYKNNKKAKTDRVILPKDKSLGIFAKESYKKYEYSSAEDKGKRIATGKVTKISYFEEGLFRYQQNDYFTENYIRNLENNGCNYGTGRVWTEEMSLAESMQRDEGNLLVKRSYQNSMPISISTKSDTASLVDGSVISYSEISKTEKTKYTKDEEVKEEIDEQNNKTEYIYEDKGDRFVPEITEEYEYYDDEDGDNPELKTTYEYDEYGNEIDEENFVLNEETGEYELESEVKTDYITKKEDESGKLAGEIEKETETDAAGLVTVTNYDISIDEKGQKKVVTSITTDGNTIQSISTYDLSGNEIYYNDGLGSITESTYDGFSRLIKQVQTTGEKVLSSEKEYNKNGSLIREESSNGIITFNEYDHLNLVSETRTIYKEETKIRKKEYGFKTIDIFTGNGRKEISKAKVQSEIIVKEDGTEEILSQIYTDVKGNTVREIAGGLITDSEYTENATLIAILTIGQEETDLENARVSLSFTDEEKRRSYTVTNPVYVEGKGYTIDKENSIVEMSEMDSAGDVILSKNALDRETKFEYDNSKNLTGVILPLASKRNYEYNIAELASAGEPALSVDKTIDAMGNTSISKKNAKGEEVEISDLGDGKISPITRKYEYDKAGRVIKELNSNGSSKVLSYNSKFELAKILYLNKDGKPTMETAYEYDIDGNQTVMADYSYEEKEGKLSENRRLIRYTWIDYDSQGRKIGFAELTREEISAANRNENKQTENGAVAENINPSPSTTEIAKKLICYKYDIEDNLVEISYSDSLTDIQVIRFEYNKYKWLTKIKAQVGGSYETLREYSYDKNAKVMAIKDYLNFDDK
ncbi:MAG: DNRLRE domain-containing protein, partial [Anaerovoracaceae bacterium]